MGKRAPGITIGGIILTHGAPLAVAEVTAPKHPGALSLIPLGNAAMLGAGGLGGSTHQFRSNTVCRWPARRKARAMVVNPVLVLGQPGKTLASAT